jgi:tetratricopeptide (TPR) repeat protein
MVCVGVALGVAAAEPGDDGKDPVFVRWLVPGDPGDETIRDYWERAERGELSAPGLVDLGTMLFNRGYPKDAVKMYRAALDIDKGLSDAWLRIGIVKHREHEYDDARLAYKKCLKLMSGHGWCNFYLGLLEEQTGHPAKALEHYETAYRHAPVLADPRVNPAVLQSELEVAAAVRQRAHERFGESAPMSYMEPQQVREVRSRYLPTPTPTPTPEPEAEAAAPREGAPPARTPTLQRRGGAITTPSGGGAEAGGSSGLVRQRPSRPAPQPPATPDSSTPYGVRQPNSSGIAGGAVRSVSPEASLAPLWQKLPEWILALV